MNKTILLVFALAASFALADTVSEYAQYAASRRYCVKREQVGDYILTYWHRDGRPDWIKPPVETNRVRVITGEEQKNPLQEQIVKLNADIKELDRQLQEEVVKYLTASNRAAVAEARVASAKSGLTEERTKWQEKYDKASALLKPVYKLGLDLIDSILAKLDALMEAAK